MSKTKPVINMREKTFSWSLQYLTKFYKRKKTLKETICYKKNNNKIDIY